MSTDLKSWIGALAGGGRLARHEASSAMGVIMDGAATDAQIGAFLAALRIRGEDTAELLGFLDAFRERARTVRLDDPDAVDLCGTGGDGSGTFNVSTVASLVVAGAGVTVAKHGNRSVSSRSGSADLLRELGVRIDAPPEIMEACINETGVGFLFAPLYHPAMKSAAKARAELGIRTCFNMLGPLANPAGVRRQVVGTWDAPTADRLAGILRESGSRAALVLVSEEGMDEVSPAGATGIREIRGGGEVRRYSISPETFGLKRLAGLSAVAGGSPADNARIAEDVLGGGRGPARDFVVMNAALGLMVARDGMTHVDARSACEEAIDSGAASARLRALRERTNR